MAKKLSMGILGVGFACAGAVVVYGLLSQLDAHITANAVPKLALYGIHALVALGMGALFFVSLFPAPFSTPLAAASIGGFYATLALALVSWGVPVSAIVLLGVAAAGFAFIKALNPPEDAGRVTA